MPGLDMSNLFNKTSCVNNTKVHSLVVVILCVVAIIIYGQVLERWKKPDLLTKKFSSNCDGGDGWGISHTMFFLMKNQNMFK